MATQNDAHCTPKNNPNDLNTSLSTLPGPNHDWSISLKHKIIAVTGANQGIGLGIAEVCLANGAEHVFDLDISEPGEPFADLASQYPGRLGFKKCDVTSERDVSVVLEEIVNGKGRLDGMVANAGATRHQAALAFSLEQVKSLFELNVYGSWNCATAAAKVFIKLGCKGSIVFTASMTSYRPNRAAPSAPYGATKAAVRNMTHTLAMEWAKYGIRVNSVSPGFVKTALTYYIETSPDWDVKMESYGGMPRLALPQELGGAYVYLLSDTATYTTGIDIPIAGIVGAWKSFLRNVTKSVTVNRGLYYYPIDAITRLGEWDGAERLSWVKRCTKFC